MCCKQPCSSVGEGARARALSRRSWAQSPDHNTYQALKILLEKKRGLVSSCWGGGIHHDFQKKNKEDSKEHWSPYTALLYSNFTPNSSEMSPLNCMVLVMPSWNDFTRLNSCWQQLLTILVLKKCDKHLPIACASLVSLKIPAWISLKCSGSIFQW